MIVLKTEIGKKEFTHEYTETKISFELCEDGKDLDLLTQSQT